MELLSQKKSLSFRSHEKRLDFKSGRAKVISYLPFSASLNYFFQKYVTKGIYLTDEYFYDRLGHAKSHIDAFRRVRNDSLSIPVVSLELGTGWYPVVPIAFFLLGVDKIYSIDIEMLTNKQRLKTTLQKFFESIDFQKTEQHLEIKEDRLNSLRLLYENIDNYSLPYLLDFIHLEYIIGDARKIKLEDSSIDLINSNNTFEHIDPDVLESILLEFRRIVKKGTGVMSHFIDMSDHFAHFDKSINIYNFLKFSKTTWGIIDNSIQPQNRYRLLDYKEIYKKLGIQIVEEISRLGDVKLVSSLKTHPDFRKFSAEELAVSHSQLVSRH